MKIRPSLIIDAVIALSIFSSPIAVRAQIKHPSVVSGPRETAAASGVVDRTAVMGGMGKTILFTENAGQWPEAVRFRADGGGATVWFTESAFYTAFYSQQTLKGNTEFSSDFVPLETMAENPGEVEYLLVKAGFVSADASAKIIPEGEIVSRSHYFLTDEPDHWITDVPSYRAIVYSDVYPGIAVRIYDGGGSLEYDFLVAPGADPSVIQMRYDGALSLDIDLSGRLVVNTPWGQFAQQRPVVYQKVGNLRRTIPAAFELRGNYSYGITLHRPYIRELPLVIDPVLTFSTFLGGGSSDVGYGVALDNDGNVLVAGATASADFPDTNAYQGTMAGGDWDACVAKLSAGGDTLFYSSYLGGSEADYGYEVAVDGNGSAYIVGRTSSIDFPTVGPIQSADSAADAFVARLSSDGSSLSYSTYLGGSGTDIGWDIVVDAAQNAYVTGYTNSADFPAVAAMQPDNAGGWDVFVAKIDNTGGALDFCTCLGGSGTDIGQAVSMDGSGRVWLTGYTASEDFPTVNASQDYLVTIDRPDMFVTRLNSTASALEYSSYLGGRKSDFGAELTLDGDGYVYILGRTLSDNFPLSNPLQGSLRGVSDLILAKLTPGGDALVFSTYLGGSGHDFAGGLVVDDSGRMYLAAYTSSPDFPNINAFQTEYGGGLTDVVVARLNAAADQFDYSTFLGGNSTDEVHGIAANENSHVYLAGQTNSADFPIKQALQNTLSGSADAFVALVTGVCIDTDEDGTCDSTDNCLTDFNPLQEDSDFDGAGDSCDVCPLDSLDDLDADGYCADVDNCPDTANPLQEDPDEDNVGTLCDNCPADFNPNQDDSDSDGQGDSCDVCPLDFFDDIDGDGYCGNVDNCPGAYNPDQLDVDSNGVGDVCEGCCSGTTGNVDCDSLSAIDVGDLTVLLSNLFISMAPLCCPGEANTDGSPDMIIDIGDVTRLIDHLFISLDPLVPCQ